MKNENAIVENFLYFKHWYYFDLSGVISTVGDRQVAPGFK